MRQCFIEAGVPAEDIFTVPHFWNARPEPSLRDDGYFLYLGRLITAKGLGVMFEAWRYVEEELGESAPRLIIGGMGPLEAEIRKASAASRRVEFVGFVGGQEKSGLIAGCAAMVAPSLWWEPLGLVTYEAYDYGKPMLAARSGGLTETVIDGSTGLLHTPGAARELAGHVIRLHRDPGLRREMGARGRSWLLEHAGEALWLERFQKAVSHVLPS
jgi:glycosyltransferase involved in cell wall biosynthesis